jgi:phage gpG-like protein
MAGAYINQADMAKLQNKIKQLKKLDRQGLSNELGQFALASLAQMKRDVPVKTTSLQKSITVTAQNKEVILEAGMKYAPYVEFGTGTKVKLSHLEELGIPETYAMQFKGKGIKEVNLPPRPFFFTTIRRQLKLLLNRIDKKIKKII